MPPAQPRRKVESARFEPLARSAFRVLGLSASASQAEVFEAAEALRLALRLGVEKKFDADLAWLAPVSRSEADVRDALGRLADPPRRAAERLFWFQCAPAAPRPAPLAALRRDAELLRAAEGPAAQHDAALFLLAALHALDPQFKERAAWADAFRLWRETVVREEFWPLLVAADLKGEFEQVLTFGEAAELRRQTPRLVSRAVADAARDAASAADFARAGRALAVLRAASLPPALLDEYENETLGPVEERVEDVCDSAFVWARLFAREVSVLPSSRKRYFDQSLRKFDAEVRPELRKFLQAAGPHSFHLRRALRHAAEKLNELAAHYRDEGWTDQARYVYRAARALAPPGAAESGAAGECLRAMGAEPGERTEEEYAAGLARELSEQAPPPNLFEVETTTKGDDTRTGCLFQIAFFALMVAACFGLDKWGVINMRPSRFSPGSYNYNSFNHNFRIAIPQFTPYTMPSLNTSALGVGRLTAAELRQRQRRGRVLVVDVRSREEYEAGHIAGALSVPRDEAGKHAAALRRRGGQVVCYGSSANPWASGSVALALRLEGLSNVAVLEGDYEAWVAAGLPTGATVEAAPPPAGPPPLPPPGP